MPQVRWGRLLRQDSFLGKSSKLPNSKPPSWKRSLCTDLPGQAATQTWVFFQALNRVPLFKAFKGRHTLFLLAVPLFGLNPWPAPQTKKQTAPVTQPGSAGEGPGEDSRHPPE